VPRKTTGDPARQSGGRSGEPPLSCPPEHLQSLLCRSRNHDAEALQELYTRFKPMLLGVLVPYGRDPTLCDQLLGQVYVEFHRLICQFDPASPVSFFAYLQRALPGAIWSFARRQRKAAWRERPFSSVPPAGAGEEPDAWGGIAERLRQRLQEEADDPTTWHGEERAILDELALERALAALTPRPRQVFLLWWKGCKGPEIAALLGISEPASRQALRRALTQVRRALEEDS
jgi:RNA polymerase sigma factor (sigma-70 family)